MQYIHDTWTIDLPDKWIAEETDDCIAFYNPDGVGALQISTHTSEEGGEVTLKELLDFSEAISPTMVALPNLSGLQETFVEDGDIFINWWLRAGRQIFYVTYVCEKGDEAIEAEACESAVNSLRPHKAG